MICCWTFQCRFVCCCHKYLRWWYYAPCTVSFKISSCITWGLSWSLTQPGLVGVYPNTSSNLDRLIYMTFSCYIPWLSCHWIHRHWERKIIVYRDKTIIIICYVILIWSYKKSESWNQIDLTITGKYIY